MRVHETGQGEEGEAWHRYRPVLWRPPLDRLLDFPLVARGRIGDDLDVAVGLAHPAVRAAVVEGQAAVLAAPLPQHRQASSIIRSAQVRLRPV